MVVEEAVIDEGPEVVDLRESADEAPVVKLVNSLVAQGVDQGASDIHFEPVGGELARPLPRRRRPRRGDAHPAQARRGRHLAHQDHVRARHRRAPHPAGRPHGAEHRRPPRRRPRRDAAARRRRGRGLRVLDKDGSVVDLDQLGMVEPGARRFVEAFSRAHGAVLVTGPTGSGKTTTLYGALTQLHTPEKNIITIEDPVEYELAGVKQMQINPKAG
jgi:type IV pilus assembly protein PilB